MGQSPQLPAMSDGMSTVRGLVGRTRSRLRLQAAVEGATTAFILATAGALAVVYGLRAGALTSTTAAVLLVACGAIVIAGAAIGASRRLDDERIARRIDRASNLSDRLSTAVAFERALTTGDTSQVVDADVDPDATLELMRAAIRDAVRAAPRADLVAAAPYALPRDWRAALGFFAVAALIAGVGFPAADHTAALTGAVPNYGPPGAHVVLHGKNLHEGLHPAQLALQDRAGVAIGAAGLPAMPRSRDRVVTLGRAEGSVIVKVLDWQPDHITIEIPADAAPGETELSAWIDGRAIGPVAFTVVDPLDANYHSEDSVELTPDEQQYAKDLIAQIRLASKDDPTEDLGKYADKLQQMLDQAEKGKLTKEQLMTALEQAEDELHKNEEPNAAEVAKDLADTGKELEKDKTTKDLGQALEKGDLDKAKQEMEKLADKIEKNQLTEKEKQDVAKAMDQAAKAFEKKDQERKDQQQQQKQKADDDVKEMERKLKDPKTTPEQKQDLERRLDEKKRELKQLKKDDDQKEQSEERRALKRLHKDMEKAAENMQQKPQDQQQQQQQQQQSSRNLKDAARETGRVDKDQRKTAAEKKASSPMEDLREALARAKRRGSKGPEDPFNKNGKESDFAKRAGGGKGNRQAWKQGQGQGRGLGKGQGQGQQGKGQGQNGGQGQGQPQGPSNDWGTGHDPNLTGDETAMSGDDTDKAESGIQGQKGGGKRETILSAAQKGFATARYKDVYNEYDGKIEDVMKAEKVPPSYKYYIKKYFNKIKPEASSAATTAP